METTHHHAVRCTSCQRQYRWDGRYAGHRIKCRCGEFFEIPIMPPEGPSAHDHSAPVVIMPVKKVEQKPVITPSPPVDEKNLPILEEDEYDAPPLKKPVSKLAIPSATVQELSAEEYDKLPVLSEEDPEEPVVHAKPESGLGNGIEHGEIELALNEPVLPPPILSAPMIEKMEMPKSKHGPSPTPVLTIEEKFEDPEEDMVEVGTANPQVEKQLYVPAVMLVLGLAASGFLWGRVEADSWGHTLTGFFSALTLQVLVFAPWAIYSTVLCAKWMDLDFGPIVPVVARFVAITLGPAAVADVLLFGLMQHEFDWVFLLVGFFFYMVLVGLPVWVWFRTNLHETMVIVLMQAAPRLVFVFILAAAMPKLFEVK